MAYKSQLAKEYQKPEYQATGSREETPTEIAVREAREEREKAGWQRDREDVGNGKPPAPPPPKPAPPVVAPEPVPPTPEIQAGIPEVEIPKEAKVVSRTATGAPEWLKTSDRPGDIYYAPSSQMHQMGFRTRQEYFDAQREGLSYGIHPGSQVPSSSVLVEVPIGKRKVTLRYSGEKPSTKRSIGLNVLQAIQRGKYKVPITSFSRGGKTKEVLISALVAEKLSELEGKSQFNKFVSLGIIPRGSKYVAGVDNDWKFTLPSELKKPKEEREEVSRANLGLNPKLDKFVTPSEKLNLTGAVAAGYTKVSDYPGWEVTQKQLDKLVAEQKKHEDARQTLKPYEKYGGKYSLVDALVSDKPEVVKATKVLFSSKDIKAAEKWIERHWGVGERLGGEPAKEIVKFYRKITPWKEEKGETLISALRELRAKVPVASPLATLIPAVTVSPIPHDDALLWLAIGGAAATTAIAKAIKHDKIPEVPEKVSKAAANFRSIFGRSPTSADLVIVSPRGMATGAIDFPPEKMRLPPLTPKDIAKLLNIPPIVARDLIRWAKIPPFRSEDLTEQFKLPPTGQKRVEPALFLPTPAVTMEDLTGQMAGVIRASAAVSTAEEGMKVATKTIPINWNKILEEARKAQTKKDIERAFSSIPPVMKGVAPEVTGHYSRAHQEYLRRRAILEAARKQYVASLNPTPVGGKASPEALDLYSVYFLSKQFDLSKPKAGEGMNLWLDRILGDRWKQISKKATTVATSTFIKQLAKGQTAKQSATKTATITSTAIQTAVKNLTATKTLTQAQIKTLAQTIARTATRTAVNSAVATNAITAAEAAATVPTTDIPPPTPTPTPPTVVRAISGSPTRQPIEQGSITFAFGVRKGVRGIKVPQWYYVPPPYNQKKPIPISYPPLGAVRTDSVNPYETIQIIGRSRRYSVPKSISIDMGVTDAFITNYGRRISFRGKGEETDVGKRLPSTTKGMSIPAVGEEPSDYGTYFNETEDFWRRFGIKGVHKPKMRKGQARRKGRENNSLTSVRGIRQ